MLLTQNSKMKKSSKNGLTVVNWTIPAFMSSSGFRTCPNAGVCAKGCYARSGTYMFKCSKASHEKKLALTQRDDFTQVMINEIESWLKKKSVKHLKVRIHDAGDFYDIQYLNKWVSVMTHYATDSRVSFYAYTKQVDMFKKYRAVKGLPDSFTVIFSYGGKQDKLINPAVDRHSKVFESMDRLVAEGYAESTADDMVAAMGVNNKIGLVFHHVKNWENTAWDRVK